MSTPDRTNKFLAPNGESYWGIPGMTEGTQDGADGWYIVGTFKEGDDGWQNIPSTRGRNTVDLEDTVRHAGKKHVVVGYVQSGDLLDYRAVHGPFPSLAVLRSIIEREVMVHSPIAAGN